MFEFPYAVSLGFFDRQYNEIRHYCGGSLINRWYVLTAAHCLKSHLIDTGVRTLIHVRVGELDFRRDPDCSDTLSFCAPKVQTIDVADVVIHDNFDSSLRTPHHDIGLIRLSEPATYNAAVKPVCLPANSGEVIRQLGVNDLVNGLVGRSVQVIGWGLSNLDNNKLNVFGVAEPQLQKARLNIVRSGKCGSIRDHQICAGARTRDSCGGDSGSPLLAYGPRGETVQVGLVSYGSKNCGGGRPAVYTRVGAFMEWIAANIEA